MKTNLLKIIICLLCMVPSLLLYAVKHEPYSGSRIYWDISSKKLLFPSGNYARVIQLQDGRLMAVAESGGGVSVSYSGDNGNIWSSPERIIQSAPNIPYAVPDVIQLTNGDIIVGFNPRPSSPYTEDRKFGIRCIRSVDNENRICFSNGSRDGMPVPILTDNNEIVVIIEDNGWGNGYNGFRATTVRTTLDDNWSNWIPRNNNNREMIFANAADKTFISAAPYIRRLGKDETIASWQGDRGERKGMGEDRYEMSVGVGDADGRNVKAIVSPFGLSTSQHGLWNSVTALDDGTVFALTSIGDAGKGNAIYSMTGYAKKGFEASYGTPVINGSSSKETWTKKNARQILLGSNSTRNLATMDFLYDENNLYFYARVIDRNIFTDKIDNDGITLALDVENCCDTYPQKGMYRIFMDVNGSLKFYAGESNKWKEIDNPESINYVVNTKSSYYEMEIAIPWNVLGCTSAPINNDMRCYIEVSDRRDGELVKEIIPESILRQSWTWPEFNLLPNENSGINDISSDISGDNAMVNIRYENGNVCVESSRDITNVSLYSVSGTRIVARKYDSNEANLNVSGMKGTYIVEVTLCDGLKKIAKLVIR